MNSQHRPFCIPSNIPLPHTLIDAMSESLPLRLTDDWVVAMRTFDVEKLAQITSPSFTFDTVDENKNVLEFSRTQYFQNLMEHVKKEYTGVDVRQLLLSLSYKYLTFGTYMKIRVARRSVNHAASIEVIQEVHS